jgi:quercetin dioxygenase-like cupin family protein
MKAGDRLDEQFAPGPITLIVREGRVRFLAAGEAVEAGPETIVTCDAGVSHSVEALIDTACILHVAGVR